MRVYGVYWVQGGGGVNARSRECGEVEGPGFLCWLGTIYRQRTMPTYNYVKNGIHNSMS
jgi:hypothetical protein